MHFVQKSNLFISAFSTEIISEKIVFDILERKEWFLDQKIEVLTKAKKWTFLKGVSPCILSKKSNFFISAFFTEIISEKIVFVIVERKEWFLDQEMEVITKAKKWTFFKGVIPCILSQNRTFSYGRFSQKSYQKKSFLILWKEKNDF